MPAAPRELVHPLPQPATLSSPLRRPMSSSQPQQEMAAEDEVAVALAEFHASRAGVRGLVESGVASVPPIFLAPSCSSSPSAPSTFAIPTIDISLPRSAIVPLVGSAARTCGFFHVTNHGVQTSGVVSAVRAFHEQPRAIRSTFYALTPVGGVTYDTTPYKPGQNQNTAVLLPWRDTLRVSMVPPTPDLGRFPAACGDALLQYHRCVTEFGKKIAGLLSEALGVGAERLESEMQLECRVLAGHYYPPCPEPTRVVGSREHTDTSIFTVLAQDGVEGFQALLDDGGWIDVPPMPGALLINIGDVLKLVSNDEYKSVEHRVQIKSTEDARVSVALFFNSAKRDDSDFFGPLPELVTAERPRRYQNFTMNEFLASRGEFGHRHSCSSTDRFRVANKRVLP